MLQERGIDDPAAITAADVAASRSTCAPEPTPPLTASSVARMLSSVRGFHRFLLGGEPGGRRMSPPRRKPPKLASRLPKALTIEQVEAVLKPRPTATTSLSLRDKALLELLYATGARVSEAVQLNVDDFVDDGDVLRRGAATGKGDKQRIVPLGCYARAAIDAYLVRARPALSRAGTRDAARCSSALRGAAAVAAERVAGHPARGRARAARPRSLAAHPAALVRHAPAAGRGRRARRAGAARPRLGRDDPDLHARLGRRAARHVRDLPSAGALTARSSSQRAER